MCYVTLKNTCDEGNETKTMDVNYLIVDTMSPNNIFLGVRPPTP